MLCHYGIVYLTPQVGPLLRPSLLCSLSMKMSLANSRPMRKGTKSCLECKFQSLGELYGTTPVNIEKCNADLEVTGRRRKARCIYSSDESRTCLRCKSRGTSCIEQSEAALRDVSSINTRVTVSKLSSRVEELEAVIRSTSRSQHDVCVSPEINAQAHEATTNPMLEEPASTSPVHDSVPASTSVSTIIEPIPSLFDNAIVDQKSFLCFILMLTDFSGLEIPWEKKLRQEGVKSWEKIPQHPRKGLIQYNNLGRFYHHLSCYHLSWTRTPRNSGGVHGKFTMNIPD